MAPAMFELRRLARLWGVYTSYRDTRGNVVVASREQLLAVLRSLDPEFSDQNIAAATRRRMRDLYARPLDPVSVVKAESTSQVPLVSEASSSAKLGPVLYCEDGTRIDLPEPGSIQASRTVDGTACVVRPIDLPALPFGYHRLETPLGSSWIFSDPGQLPTQSEKILGAFAPLYALRGDDNWQGGATFSDVEELGAWLGSHGGAFATLPLLAGFYEDAHEPSPYRPISRRHWNELYLDLRRVVDFETTPEARQLASDELFRQRGLALADSAEIDYQAWYRHKKGVLEALAESCWNTPARRASLESFLDKNSDLVEYAHFRSTGARFGRAWSELHRDRDASFRYHCYVQWQTRLQLSSISEALRAAGPGLYLDMPVGVHPDGYDAFADAESFASAMSAGAPPDDFFSEGQGWALPVLHPRQSSETGHAHLRASLRAHLEFAGVLRVDHVMGLSRLFWVPHGMSAAHGVYVSYPRDELFAALAIEAKRADSIVIGEDLGTVPGSVREVLQARQVGGMYVSMFDLPNIANGNPWIPPGCAASLNTHDTPTFAGFCSGADIDVQRQLGIIDDQQKHNLENQRRDSIAHLMDATHTHSVAELRDQLLCVLAASQAFLVLITLEDLWLEQLPQNVPGTGPERQNWRRRLARTNAAIVQSPEISKLLEKLTFLRRGGEPSPGP